MSLQVRLLLGPAARELETDGASSCQSICDAAGIDFHVQRAEHVAELLDALRKPGQSDVFLVDPGGRQGVPVADYRSALAAAGSSARVIELRPGNELAKSEGFGPVLPPGVTQGFVAGFGNQSCRLALRSLSAADNPVDNVIGNPTNDIDANAANLRTIHVLNGPNLNLLGTREPTIYGSETLDDIAARCAAIAAAAGASVLFRQSNSEGQLVDWIQEAIGSADALVINAAAYTHTSVALHDALRNFEGMKVELHISNPHAREKFRHHSYISSAVDAVVVGLGPSGYAATVAELTIDA